MLSPPKTCEFTNGVLSSHTRNNAKDSGGGDRAGAVFSDGTTSVKNEVFNIVNNLLGAGALGLPSGVWDTGVRHNSHSCTPFPFFIIFPLCLYSHAIIIPQSRVWKHPLIAGTGFPYHSRHGRRLCILFSSDGENKADLQLWHQKQRVCWRR